MSWTAPARWLLPSAVALALLMAACGGSAVERSTPQDTAATATNAAESVAPADGGEGAQASPSTPEQSEPQELRPVIVTATLAVGPARIAFGLVGDRGLVLDATVRADFYTVDEAGKGSFVTAAELAPVHMGPDTEHGGRSGHGDPPVTVYVANVELTQAGLWGAVLTVDLGGRRYENVPLSFQVLDDLRQVWPGDVVPATEQTTLSDVDEISRIDTAAEPVPAMHERTVAEALALRRPMVIAFATPMFCGTRFCGPIVDGVVQPLYEEYGDRVEFIHIEPYDVERARAGEFEPVPAMAEWGLLTEPWVFVVDANGRVTAAFEGVTSRDEVETALVDALTTADRG